MSNFIKELLTKEQDANKPIIDSAECIDCEWSGLLSECYATETEEDFVGNQVEVPICPKCEGGLDNYYPSSLID